MPVLPGMPVITRRSSPRLQPRVDPGDGGRVRPHCGVDQQALEGVVEVPTVVQVLVVPGDLPRVGVEGEGGVVVQVLVPDHRRS